MRKMIKLLVDAVCSSHRPFSLSLETLLGEAEEKELDESNLKCLQ